MKNKYITVSIDDGHPLDLKAAKILLDKNIPAIFYIPIKNSTGRPTLNKKQIKWLSQQPGFEIGGHTYNHVDLTKIPLAKAEVEMRSGKKALEDIVGKPVTTFAWPWGKYNKNLVLLAKRIGFLDCRSTTTLNLNPVNRRAFLWCPNLHIYPHIRLRGLINCIRRGDMYSFFTRLRSMNRNYLDTLSFFKEQRMYFHVWFHSWEINELNMWNYIEKL